MVLLLSIICEQFYLASLLQRNGAPEGRAKANETEMAEGSAGHRDRAEPADTYKVTVDYNQSLAEMVAAGKYDHVGKLITPEYFPHDRNCLTEEVEIYLVCLNRGASRDDEAIAELDRMGFRPATLQELLALGAAYPDLQRRFWIVALGSGWRNPAALSEWLLKRSPWPIGVRVLSLFLSLLLFSYTGDCVYRPILCCPPGGERVLNLSQGLPGGRWYNGDWHFAAVRK